MNSLNLYDNFCAGSIIMRLLLTALIRVEALIGVKTVLKFPQNAFYFNFKSLNFDWNETLAIYIFGRSGVQGLSVIIYLYILNNPGPGMKTIR